MDWNDELVVAYIHGYGIRDEVAITSDMFRDAMMSIAHPTNDREDDLVRAWVSGATDTMRTNIEQESDPTQNPDIWVQTLAMVEAAILIRSNS